MRHCTLLVRVKSTSGGDVAWLLRCVLLFLTQFAMCIDSIANTEFNNYWCATTLENVATVLGHHAELLFLDSSKQKLVRTTDESRRVVRIGLCSIP